MFHSISVKATEANRHALRSPEEELRDPRFSSPKSAISPPDGHKRPIKYLALLSVLVESTETTEVSVFVALEESSTHGPTPAQDSAAP